MKKRILICDDDEGILDVVSIILNQQGYAVTALSNSEKVIETVIDLAPDVILLDLWMPNVSGDELTLQLKGKTATKNIPIIIVSASKDTEKIAKNAGADDFIVKPFDIEELEGKVSQYTN